MIPEIDGISRNQVPKFLNASTYAMSEINPADERSLLRAILCTKLTGRAMYDFQTRDIRSFAQLKQETEMCYLLKRGTAHIQREFNMTRQKPGESAREYGLRLDKLAMELYHDRGKRALARATESDTRYDPRISTGKFPARSPRRYIDNSTIA